MLGGLGLLLLAAGPGWGGGSDNTNYGSNSLASDTTGSANSAFGDYALYLNTTGSDNVGIGDSALYSNVGGSNNTATGSGRSPTTPEVTTRRPDHGRCS